MEDRLIEFETAKLAKEKGLCNYFEFSLNKTKYVPAFYSEDGINFEETEFQLEDCVIEDRYYRPTQSLLQKWLREVHNIDIIPYPVEMKNDVRVIPQTKDIEYHYKIWVDGVQQDTYGNPLASYEEALEVGLLEGLKLKLEK